MSRVSRKRTGRLAPPGGLFIALVAFVTLLFWHAVCMMDMAPDAVAAAGTFGGGLGSPDDPYIIEDVHDLQAMNEGLDKHYTLAHDIEAGDTADWHGGEGFIPLGTESDPFTGTLQGGGHTIRGLHINRGSGEYVGLFGHLTGSVLHLRLEDLTLTGGSMVGGLAGSIRDGSINNVSVSGVITGERYVGGLAGNSLNLTVSGSGATGSVIGTDEEGKVGGLVGNIQSGSVIDCYAWVTVTSSGNDVGGLVGSNAASVSGSRAGGDVTGWNSVGGILGVNRGGSVSGSNATGKVMGSGSFVGGLIGFHLEGTVEHCHAKGNVTGSGVFVGGLAGLNWMGDLNHCHATSRVTGLDRVGGLVGGNDEGSMNHSWYAGDVTGEGWVGGLVGWNHRASVNNSHSGGRVTGEWYVGGLVGDNLDGHISDSRADGNVTGTAYVGGLAGSNRGQILHSSATGQVNGAYDTGGLVGANHGRISRSRASVVVAGDTHIGGLVGSNAGELRASFSVGSISGTNSVGGLAGLNNGGTVNDSYAWGTVSGTYYFGGLVGRLQSGSVNASYAAVRVIGLGPMGGLVGVGASEGMVHSSFWDTEVSGKTMSTGGTGRTTGEMKTRRTFTDAGWDFEDLWIMTENVTYPLLKWQDTPTAHAGPDQMVDAGATVTFDGSTSADREGIINYTWSFTDHTDIGAGPIPAPVSLYGVMPNHTFTVPGIYRVTLEITNASGVRNTDTMTVMVRDITPPEADAGPDRQVDEGTTVTFNGTASTDNVGIAAYFWSFHDGTSELILHGVAPGHTFTVPGEYHVTLRVTDAVGHSDTDTMTVTVMDITPPEARAGPSLIAPAGSRVVFDGSGSWDNVGVINHTWTFTYNGSDVTLFGVSPSFRFWTAGEHTVLLTVTDAAGNQATDMVMVTITEGTEDEQPRAPDDRDRKCNDYRVLISLLVMLIVFLILLVIQPFADIRTGSGSSQRSGREPAPGEPPLSHSPERSSSDPVHADGVCGSSSAPVPSSSDTSPCTDDLPWHDAPSSPSVELLSSRVPYPPGHIPSTPPAPKDTQSSAPPREPPATSPDHIHERPQDDTGPETGIPPPMVSKQDSPENTDIHPGRGSPPGAKE